MQMKVEKILCIGDLAGGKSRSDLRFFFGLPDAEFVHLGESIPSNLGLNCISLADALYRFKSGEYEMVVYGKIPSFFYNPRKGMFSNMSAYTKSIAKFKSFRKCSRARKLLGVFSSKLVIIDLDDRSVIDNSRFDQAFHSRLYFKRELPQNPANAFLYTSSKNEDNGNISRQDFFKLIISKLRPISIGIQNSLALACDEMRAQKSADVFFSGQLNGRPNRVSGAKSLFRLREQGFRVDFPDCGLSHTEFLSRCAGALTVWSPEGFGYECYRTYEAATQGAVPILQYPTIHRHAPFIDGQSALYYGVENDHLFDVLRRSLGNPETLKVMGERAKSHALLHHTHSALSEHIRAAFRSQAL
jgi:hypothetical protein